MNQNSNSEIPVKLSYLWIFVMFNMAMADIIGFIQPGTLENIIRGDFGFTLTPALVVIISLLTALPIAMILVSRWCRREWSRPLNIAASLLTILYVLGGGSWDLPSYYVFASLEVAAMLAIIWLAWTWRKVEA